MNTEKSPFKRLREATGMSKSSFYKHALIAESTLTFVEAGLYERTPERAERALIELCLVKSVPFQQILADEYDGAGTIDTATVTWQKAVRAALHDRVVEAYERVRSHPDHDLSPLENFAQAVSGSKTGFCKEAKVQVAVFYQFDRGLAQKMPGSLYAALYDTGLAERYIQELEEEQMHWVRDNVAPAVA